MATRSAKKKSASPGPAGKKTKAKTTNTRSTAAKDTATKKVSAKNTAAGNTSATNTAAKKTAAKKTAGKKTAGKQTATRAAKNPSRNKKTKDPAGGLTQAGREYFAKKEGSHLKPGVKGAADTPEKKKRKGSFLRRHFANPRGPMEREGEPTRLALSAQAWGEPLPKTDGDAKRLAAKGSKLLADYKTARE